MHDDARLEALGIRRYESKRLRLYSDIAPEDARVLPPLIDAAYDAWVEYFGPLPPDRAGRAYQMTGYLMADGRLFAEAGLVPGDLPPFLNGRHRDDCFWVREQTFDYYRRHLVVHEATHCFMTVMRGMNSLAPVWYFEGMAELFGTHRLEAGGGAVFRAMPRDRAEVSGDGRTLGRIELIRQAVADGRTRTLAEVRSLRAWDYSGDDAYAWSWALCKLLDAHPRYRERFRQLGTTLSPAALARAFDEAFGEDLDELETEWALFIDGLEYGYDIERAAIAFRPGSPLESGGAVREAEVDAARGWQPSGVRVEAGLTYDISATGRFTLAQQPKPWESEADGISFRYVDGLPLGRLLAAIRAEPPAAAGEDAPSDSMLKTLSVGRSLRLTPAQSGTLYMRVNDAWSELADNTGGLRVRVRRVK
ncbi:MAG: hypothetical protein KY476_10760 [Planctomycetes bacterium]|nr:hypothetical protein [Planctomycetota bacterium]